MAKYVAGSWTVTKSGSLTTTKYNVKNDNYQSVSNTNFSFSGVTVKLKWSGGSENTDAGITKFEIQVGGKVYRTFNCRGGNIFFAQYNYFAFDSGKEYELDFKDGGVFISKQGKMLYFNKRPLYVSVNANLFANILYIR